MTVSAIVVAALCGVAGYIFGRWSLLGGKSPYWAGWREGWIECREEFESAFLTELSRLESGRSDSAGSVGMEPGDRIRFPR